jgi:hypothetical protein
VELVRLEQIRQAAEDPAGVAVPTLLLQQLRPMRVGRCG